MGHLSLSLPGPFQATVDGAPVHGLASSMARALLAYLAVEADSPHPHFTDGQSLQKPEGLVPVRCTLLALRRISDVSPTFEGRSCAILGTKRTGSRISGRVGLVRSPAKTGTRGAHLRSLIRPGRRAERR